MIGPGTMKTPPVSLVALVIGLGLGVLVTKGLNRMERSERGGAEPGAGEVASRPSKRQFLQVAGGPSGKDQEPTSGRGTGIGRQRTYEFHTLFSSWAREDPDAAIADLEDLKGEQKQQASRAIAAVLAATDPDRAMAFVMGMTGLNEQNSALTNVIATITASDPQRALQILEGMPSGQRRTGVLSAIASHWLQSDPEGALSWVNSLSTREKSQALEQGIWGFMQCDVKTAAELLSSLPPNNRNSHHYSNIASHWAQNDPSAAMEWVGKHQQSIIYFGAPQQWGSAGIKWIGPSMMSEMLGNFHSTEYIAPPPAPAPARSSQPA
jgi:hypothetical protein